VGGCHIIPHTDMFCVGIFLKAEVFKGGSSSVQGFHILVFVLTVATLHKNLPNLKFERPVCQGVVLSCICVIDGRMRVTCN
jgi:hypothetical protein